MRKKEAGKENLERSISLSIKEGKWIALSYDSKKEGRLTSFWCYIRDIDPKTRVLTCDVFNDYKGTETLENVRIAYERIISAEVLELTTGGVNEALISKINADLPSFSWLRYENFDNNILRYLELCCQADGDPCIKKTTMIDGVDSQVLQEEGAYPLSEAQIHQMARIVKEEEMEEWNDRFNELALSRVSIDIGEDKYVVAYQSLCFSPKEKSIRLSSPLRLNPTFLIQGRKHSLSSYTELSPEEFLESLNENFPEGCCLLREACRKNELIDTRPNLFCLSRQYQVDYSSLFDGIERKWAASTLEAPMRAFFGNSSYADNGRSKPSIVLFDSKVNADQAFAIYSALKNKVTYVQGPPGTGKTNTIFNVLLSCFFNGKNVLVSTNNNRPLDGIAGKIEGFFLAAGIPFPYLRIGNRAVVKKSLERLSSLLSASYKPTMTLVEQEALRKKVLSKNGRAVDDLTAYQQRKAYLDNLEFLSKLGPDEAKREIVVQRKRSLEKKLALLPPLTEEELIASFLSLHNDPDAISYLKEASCRCLSKLASPRFQQLRDLLGEGDEEKRATAFNSFLRVDENLRLLSEAFPILFSTNLSCEKLGTSYLFDLVVMDEAGQSDIARALLPISRGRSLLLVGDEDQLLPVVNLDPSIDRRLREGLSVSSTYDYLSNSILSCMKEADKVSNRILLRSHYRCGKKIIAFNNDYFYSKQLRISPSLQEGEVLFCPSRGNVRTPLRNQNFQEAVNVVAYLKKSDLKDVSVITPFVNQASLINSLLAKEGIGDVKASTIHSVQGDEKDLILISAGISPYSSKKTVQWLNSHGEIANVAVSRAKRKLVVFGDEESLRKMSTGDGVWNELFSYCKGKGEVEVVAPQYENASPGKSNLSLFESDFYQTISQIISVKGKMRLVRNVRVSDVLGGDFAQSQQEFDSVLYAQGLFEKEKPLFAFEFDGGEHFKDEARMKADKKKAEACASCGLRLMRIPNSFSRDYEFLKSLIEEFAKGNPSAEQLSLF